MKRIITVIIAVCYLCLSIGVVMHVHYCMGKMVGVSLLEQNDDHYCSHCGMDKKSSKNGCCKDEHKVIKAATDQALLKSVVSKVRFCDGALLIGSGAFTYNKIPVIFISSMVQTHVPPLITPACPIYIRIRNLRV